MIQQLVEQSSDQPPRFAPWSHDLGRPWLPLTHVLHAHLAAPAGSSCCVSCWVTRMSSTVLHPSFRTCQVEPMTCTSRCALPKSACRLPMSALPNSSTAPVLVSLSPDEFSCLAWTFQHPVHVRQQSVLPIFLWWTYSRTNLRCWFIPLLAWLPAPLDTVLDSLLKCAPHAHLTLLHQPYRWYTYQSKTNTYFSFTSDFFFIIDVNKKYTICFLN
jgi:hypothetical protein